MLKTRTELEKAEAQFLAPYAMKSFESIGRVYPDTEDHFRLPFQRDRDRILHSKAFRRLQAKTQVFVSYFGDHYRDRLTHSLEVSQIARDISRTLGLNEDLSECLALAHDLGHPPFGHGGEFALDEMMRPFGLHFEHNEQSRRILEKLEKIYPSFDGLNVSKEVLDGLLKHNPHQYQTFIDFQISAHLEGQVVDISDEIAYTNHDVDDGLRSGLITAEELGTFQLWRHAEEEVRLEYNGVYFEKDEATIKRFRSRIIAKMISQMIADIQSTTAQNLERYRIDHIEKVRQSPIKLVHFSTSMEEHLGKLRDFLMAHFYLHEKVQASIHKGKNTIKRLFQYYLAHPEKLPGIFYAVIQDGELPEVVIKDYIAGMTDHYAEEIERGINN